LHCIFQFSNLKNIITLKIFNLLLLASLLAVSAACNKDDDDPSCTDLGDTIVGSWSISALEMDLGDVEFKADGTLIDPDDALIGGEVGGVVLDEKSYVVNSNSSFTAKAEKGSNSVEFEYEVTAFSCDEITLDVLGIVAKMTRN
jgi:hypothetical protein